MSSTKILLIILGSIILALLIIKKPTEKPVAPDPLTIKPMTSTAPAPQPSITSLKQFTKAENVIDQTRTYQAALVTDLGDIIIQLNTQTTPITVNNFVFLAQQGFYNQTIFHRVINDFMIQGGDPKGNGTGGPGYQFNDESFTGEYVRGTVAMANSGPNTNGSQFFIIHKDTPLPKNYVIFGQVIEGLETVDAIAASPVAQNSSGEKSQPVKPIILKTVTIKDSSLKTE